MPQLDYDITREQAEAEAYWLRHEDCDETGTCPECHPAFFAYIDAVILEEDEQPEFQERELQ